MEESQNLITDVNEIAGILKKTARIRIGINGPDYPYVVPVSFGYKIHDNQITLYFHGKKTGLKHDLITRDNHVCVEADTFKGYWQAGEEISCRYESIIGFGKALVAKGDEIVHGLELILSHAGYPKLQASTCAAANFTRVYKVTLTSVTGKRRMMP